MNPVKTALRIALGKRLPRVDGELAVYGLEDTVVIRRDRFGIPHIEATNSHDVFFGLGFCQGQDRSFQLEVLLRLGRGTLSEVVGADTVPIDRLSRRIGFWRTAGARLDLLDEPERQAVEAFAAGARAAVGRGLPAKAHEFALLGIEPTPFEPADTIALLAVVAFTLAANWDSELARLEILMSDGPEALAAVDPSYPEWHPSGEQPLVAAGPALDRLAHDVAAFRDWVGLSGGSNSWALAPRKTSTGGALLANDPHLAPTLPAHWYLCHLSTPHWGLAGASFVGAPGVASGHNGFAAWGVTAGLVDNTDLYLEEIGPDGRSLRRGDEIEPCQALTEVIGVKDSDPVIEEVLVTDRGPIIGPALDGEHEAISLQATWLRPQPVKGLLSLQQARSIADLRAAFTSWPGSSLGIAYADTGGTIGWQIVGDTPRRRKGGGTIPHPGWDPSGGWEDDLASADSMPSATDPDSGFVVAANQRPTGAGTHPYLGVDWIDGYRASRIAEALSRRDDWDVAATAALQIDRVSLPWRDIRDIVLDATAGRPDVHDAHDALAGWDGVVSPDSEAAALFELFFAELDHRIVLAKAPRSVEWALGRGFTPVVPHSLFALRRAGFVVKKLREQPENWFPEGWAHEISAALATAHRLLMARPERTWGRVRPLVLRHPIGERPPLDRVFNLGPIPWGGDTNTVGQSSPDPMRPASDVTLAIASLRVIIDLDDVERSRYVLPGGQSGNPFSGHYSDQLRLWRLGDGVPIPWHRASVLAATHHTLQLSPLEAQPTNSASS